MVTAVDTQHFSIIIKFENEMTAGALGSILLNTEKIYNILNKRMIHKQSLIVRNITRGSYVIDFLGSPETLKSLHSLWDLVGGNAVWDLIKVAGGVVSGTALIMLKRLVTTNTDSSVKDAESMASNISTIMSIAAKNKYDVIFDYKNSKLICFDGSNSHNNKREKEFNILGNYSSRVETIKDSIGYLIEEGKMDLLEDFPTRRTRIGQGRHSRNKGK